MKSYQNGVRQRRAKLTSSIMTQCEAFCELLDLNIFSVLRNLSFQLLFSVIFGTCLSATSPYQRLRNVKPARESREV